MIKNTNTKVQIFCYTNKKLYLCKHNNKTYHYEEIRMLYLMHHNGSRLRLGSAEGKC